MIGIEFVSDPKLDIWVELPSYTSDPVIHSFNLNPRISYTHAQDNTLQRVAGFYLCVFFMKEIDLVLKIWILNRLSFRSIIFVSCRDD